MASNTAKEILKEIGGASNIVDFTHCATRLRFNLHDATKIDKSKVESIKGVLGAVPQSDTSFQVIIGGGLILKEHEAAMWLTKKQLDGVEWLPADVILVENIRNNL